MRSQDFIGTGVAVITPFTVKGEVDHDALKRIVKHLIEGGIDYIVALGTTGETPTLSKSEKFDVLDTIFKANDGALPIAIGAGGNNTPEVINWIKELEKYPHSGLLSVAPYYNKPSQTGMMAHFRAIANSTDKPIILYNVPGRTASNISANTTIALAQELENICCIKEASGNMDQIMAIENGKPDGFYVLSGDDSLTLPMMSVGTKGVISVIAQAYPREFSSMVSAANKGDFKTAKEIHYHLLEITNAIYLEGNPVGIKSLMKQMSLCEKAVRLPLVEATEDLDDMLKSQML